MYNIKGKLSITFGVLHWIPIINLNVIIVINIIDGQVFFVV